MASGSSEAPRMPQTKAALTLLEMATDHWQGFPVIQISREFLADQLAAIEAEAASAGLDGLRAALEQALDRLERSWGLADLEHDTPEGREENAMNLFFAIEEVRAALAGEPTGSTVPEGATSTEEPRWCGIHQHYKWCQHNGGVLGKTGYEAPTSTEEPRA